MSLWDCATAIDGASVISQIERLRIENDNENEAMGYCEDSKFCFRIEMTGKWNDVGVEKVV